MLQKADILICYEQHTGGPYADCRRRCGGLPVKICSQISSFHGLQRGLQLGEGYLGVTTTPMI